MNHGEDQFELLDNHIIQGTHPFSLALGNIDDDENLDVITADDFNDQLSVHLGNGDGTFQAPILIDIPGTPIDVELADLDGDGRLEAGVVLRDTEQLAIIKNEDLLRTHFPLVTKILIGKQPQGLKFLDHVKIEMFVERAGHGTRRRDTNKAQRTASMRYNTPCQAIWLHD